METSLYSHVVQSTSQFSTGLTFIVNAFFYKWSIVVVFWCTKFYRSVLPIVVLFLFRKNILRPFENQTSLVSISLIVLQLYAKTEEVFAKVWNVCGPPCIIRIPTLKQFNLCVLFLRSSSRKSLIVRWWCLDRLLRKDPIILFLVSTHFVLYSSIFMNVMCW